MNIVQLQQELQLFCEQNEIDKIGFASVEPFTILKERLKHQQELQYESGFEERDVDLRTDVTRTLPTAASIIAIALAYPSKIQNPPVGKKGERRGVFCRASWGVDYHVLVREKLQLIEAFLKERVPSVECVSMVDTGVLVDRAVAERAGIGWSAKNCSIITPEFGSYVYLGEMITNIPFEPSQPIEDECGDCTLCLDVCPTGALVQGGQINAKRCIAFLTQTKDYIPNEFRHKIGNRVYGCDTCQTICPKNKGIHSTWHEAMQPKGDVAKPLLLPLLQISNKEWKEQFGHVSGAWRGKKPIQRNAIIGLAHFKDEESLPGLIHVLQKDPRPVLRGTAAWALGKIGGEMAEGALLKAEQLEKDAEALQEIKQALGMFKEK